MYFNDDLRIQTVTHNEVTNAATLEWFEDGGTGKANLITANSGNHVLQCRARVEALG